MLCFVIIPWLLTMAGSLLTQTIGSLPFIGGLFGSSGLGGAFTGLGGMAAKGLAGVGAAMGGGPVPTALFGTAAPIGSGGMTGTVLPASLAGGTVEGTAEAMIASAAAPSAKGITLAQGAKLLTTAASLAGAAKSFQQPPIGTPTIKDDAETVARRRRALFSQRKQTSRNVFSHSVFGDEPTLIRPTALGPGGATT